MTAEPGTIAAESKANTAAKEKGSDLQRHPTRELAILALLFGLAIVSFAAVGALSRVYHAQQDALGNRWFRRGVNDLKAGHFEVAVTELRTALLYSRDSYSYQLNLAQALMGMKKMNEAYAYLINLWEREPEDGAVNLELARIAAERGEIDQALRYYHNAIYATWPGDEEKERRETRLELIGFLLKINAKAQAQSELIALAANVGEDPSQQIQIGDLFMQVQDYQDALAAYHASLRVERHNAAALAGAGLAAFELGRYPIAQHYLQEAVTANPKDTQNADRLKTTEFVLRMDPFRPQISSAERNRIVVEAFDAAGERLKACSAVAGSSASAMLQQGLAAEWTKKKPQVTESGLRRNPDLLNAAMELVFSIERETSACGTLTDMDQALLLIAKMHEGS